jgi:peptidyl-dipeptidase Dcp
MSRAIATTCLVILAAAIVVSAQKPEAPVSQSNPLLKEWTTPFGVPPFQDIKSEHFIPAFKAAIEQQRAEVDRIAASIEPPSFANTVEALENSGILLDSVRLVFRSLAASETNDALQAVNRETAPMLAAITDDVRMNRRLFARIKAVWDERERLSLTGPQRKLLDDTYKDFVRSGANLDAAGQARLRVINAELSSLGVAFDENRLHDTNAYRLVIQRREDLAGLPPDIVEAAAEAATAASLPGKWVFGLPSPSIWPFLSYADNRELRRQILAAYTSRCDHGDRWDNKTNAARQASLRLERSALLGYKTFADYALEEAMAKKPAAVYDLLNRLWVPAREMAIKEAAALQEMGAKSEPAFTLEAADWRYYTEKVRKARFDLDEEALRPYFSLDRVRDGAFALAGKLYGLTFVRRTDLPVYHPEVATFEVRDRNGSHLGILYTDFHPRPGKNAGAWSDIFRKQWVMSGRDIRPLATVVCNFPRPVGGAPALVGLEDVQTLFHEFGHALHSLFSRVPYRGLNDVPTDFVELPSQIMENWALEPEVLKLYATHYKTGELIPADLVAKIKKSETFNQGFITVEYLAACLLDMDWHTLTTTAPQDATTFDRAAMEKIRLLPEIVVRYRSPYFSHVFGDGGSYAAGYYSYIWSEVLDKDAFEAFKEKGLFDQPTAAAFRVLLEKGGSEEAMALYRAFRGREPSIEPLLKARGLK